MNIATVDNLPAQSNRAVSNPWRIAQGVIWGSLAVVVLSGWFVVTRLGLRQDLRVWDVMALRFGEGAVFLTPVLLVGPLRLRVQAWPSGIILALLWGAPFVLLVRLGLQATSATMTSTVTPALMPVFRRVSVRNWASPVSRQARSPQLSGWSRMPSRSSAAARRSKMIALNREDPAALDRRFVDMKPALAEAVRDDSAF
jgi:EamA-like transporter family protein